MKSSPAISSHRFKGGRACGGDGIGMLCGAVGADTERLAFAGRLVAQKAERRWLTVPGNSATDIAQLLCGWTILVIVAMAAAGRFAIESGANMAVG
ncbi:MAG: hypothetical protein IPP23_15115 [Sphingomonadales bacterium]|nr:hypothetical protein [Sphingomonadales bacterium]